MKPNLDKIKEGKTIKELLEFSIINIDKSSGPTSFNVSDFVRKVLGARKTSHFGTLDPKVTGVLPIAINRGCKLTGYFLGEDKTYIGIARFHEKIDLEKIKETINKKFTGRIIQLPPVKSRVKREYRERGIYSFEILESEEKDLLFKVKCEGGTYIRKLISDLGDELSIGAHMLELRRTNAGIFFENDEKYPSVNLYDFEKVVYEYKNGNEEPLRKILIPGEVVSELYENIEIIFERADAILHGSPIYFEDLIQKVNLEKDTKVVVFSKNKFIGIFKVLNEGRIFAKAEFTLQ